MPFPGNNFNGGPNNVPYNADAWEEMRRQSSEALKSIRDGGRESSDVANKAAQSITGAYKKTAVNSAEAMNDFYRAFQKSIKETHKIAADNATDMFNLHVMAQKKIEQAAKASSAATTQAAKQAKKEVQDSINFANVSMNEMLAALTSKATMSGNVIDKLAAKSKAASKGGSHRKSLGGVADKLENVSKLQTFTGGELVGQLASRAGANVAGAGLAQVGELAGSIGPALMRLTPQLAALGSAAGFITAIVKALWELDGVVAKVGNEVGGNDKLATEYVKRLTDLQIAAHKSRDELAELADAIEYAGTNVKEGGKRIDDYLVLASSFNRVMGVSNEQLASIIEAQIHAGKTAEQTHDIYDAMYQTMQRLGLGLKDFNEALSSGEGMWRSYGAISGASMDQMQDDMVKVTAMFKGLNVDVRHAKESMNSLMDDPKKRRAQAIFVSQMTGMSARQAMTMQEMDPAAYQQQLVSAAGNYLTRNKNAHWELDRDSRKGLSDSANGVISENRIMGLDQAAAISKVNKSELMELLNDYQSYASKHKGADWDDFMGGRANDQKSREEAGGFDKAKAHLDSSGQEMFNQAGRGIGQFVQEIAGYVRGIAQKFGVPVAGNTGGTAPAEAKGSSAGPSQSNKSSSGAGTNLLTQAFSLGALPGAALVAGHAGAQTSATHHNFGWLSGRFESGNPGKVADYMFHGRRNVAYGAWQLDAGMGTHKRYLNWAKNHDQNTYNYLAPFAGDAMAGAHGNFGTAWATLGKAYPEQFKESQRQFAKAQYLDPLLKGFGALNQSDVLKEVAFSTSIHHGQGGASNILKKAGIGRPNVPTADLIRNIYSVRDQETGGKFHDRFSRESAIALKALAEEQKKTNALLAEANDHHIQGNETSKKALNQANKMAMLPGHTSGAQTQSALLNNQV